MASTKKWPVLAQWRVHIVPKIQPRDRTFVLTVQTIQHGLPPMPSAFTEQRVVIDWYGNDMAAAKWILQLKGGASFEPPNPPSRNSSFNIVHESTEKILAWPSGQRLDPRWDHGIREAFPMFGDPNNAGTLKPAYGAVGVLDPDEADEAANAIYFDALASPYVAINNVGGERVLDVQDGKTDPGTQVLGWGWNGGDNQQWKLEFVY